MVSCVKKYFGGQIKGTRRLGRKDPSQSDRGSYPREKTGEIGCGPGVSHGGRKLRFPHSHLFGGRRGRNNRVGGFRPGEIAQPSAPDSSPDPRPRSFAGRVRQKTLESLNPEVGVQTYSERIHSANIREIIIYYDLVFDGSDNFLPRFLVNDACFFEKKF